MTVRAQRPISSGEEVTVHYISFMYGHLRRKKDIVHCWYFNCGCRRCKDPTELGSMMSAFKCGNCDEASARVLPIDAENLESDWQCNMCKNVCV
jgi:hypothetical protein